MGKDETGTKIYSTMKDLYRDVHNAAVGAAQDAVLFFLNQGYEIGDLVVTMLPSEFNKDTGKLSIHGKIAVRPRPCGEEKSLYLPSISKPVRAFLMRLQMVGIRVTPGTDRVHVEGWISGDVLTQVLDAYPEPASESQT